MDARTVELLGKAREQARDLAALLLGIHDRMVQEGEPEAGHLTVARDSTMAGLRIVANVHNRALPAEEEAAK